MKNKKSNLAGFFLIITCFISIVILSIPTKKWTEVEVDFPANDTIIITLDSVQQMSREDTINAMAMAFAKQESDFNHQAVSPCGRWVGCLQLSEIIVREANRIIDSELFDYNDRYDKACSYEIFKIIQQHHNKNLDIDRAIDLWNPKCDHQYRESVKNFYCCNIHNYSLLENYFEIK